MSLTIINEKMDKLFDEYYENSDKDRKAIIASKTHYNNMKLRIKIFHLDFKSLYSNNKIVYAIMSNDASPYCDEYNNDFINYSGQMRNKKTGNILYDISYSKILFLQLPKKLFEKCFPGKKWEDEYFPNAYIDDKEHPKIIKEPKRNIYTFKLNKKDFDKRKLTDNEMKLYQDYINCNLCFNKLKTLLSYNLFPVNSHDLKTGIIECIQMN